MQAESLNKLDRVYAEIENRLSTGKWAVGDRIPTEAQLAAEFGCSMGTVSKAIARFTHAHAGVLERRTRGGTRVMRDIREGASGANSLDLDACAMVFPGEPHEGIWAVVRGFQKAAQAAGRRTVMLTSGPDVRKEAEIIGRLSEFDVKGAVVYPVMPEPRDQMVFAQMAKACRFPVVFADLNIPGANCPAVIADGFHAGYTATRHLIDGGLKKIGFLANHAWATSMRDRYLGYRRALEEAGLPEVQDWVRLDPVMHPDFANPMAEPYRIARDYLRGSKTVEGVVCANDFLAIGCVGVANELGLTVPDDLRVVGIDNLAASASTVPGLTTYAIPNERIGERAFTVLNDLIQGRHPPVQETLMRGELVVRRSG